MNVHVYVGPTLSRREVELELPGAQVFAPVAFGDVYRSVKARARAIAIVDGYFERTPAVWHKEILWAMSEGVHVFGAASMGALRAAELADFGMHGVGSIFEAFRSGMLEDDDEVTIVHANAEEGFAPHSEAMVNLRATFAAAADAGVISGPTRDALTSAAKKRFYAERSFKQALEDAAKAGANPDQLRALQPWLVNGRVDQKANDARELLRHLRDWQATQPKPLRVGFRLEPTDAWLEACRIADANGTGITARAPHDALEEELKLTGSYVAVRDAAIARAAALDEARRSGFKPDDAAVAQAAESLRRDLGLFDHADFLRWQNDQRLERGSVLTFFEDQARLLWSREQALAWARDSLSDHLRACNRYGELMQRAEAKARFLEPFGPRGPALADCDVTEEALWGWFFEVRLSQRAPTDLDQFAKQSGFADKDEMRSAALRELLFSKATLRPSSSR